MSSTRGCSELPQPREPHAWAAEPEATPQPSAFVALFNAGDAQASISVGVRDAGLPEGSTYCVRDLWARSSAGTAQGTLAVSLPPHGAGLYLLTLCAGI